VNVPNVDQLPPDIVQSTRAVVWKFETRDGKATKVPYIPHRPSERAKVDDPRTWNTFWVAYDAVVDGKADGIGIVLIGDDDLIGTDLDGCVKKDTAVIGPEALAIVQLVNSYTEITPSGKGLRIFARGHLPPGRRVRRGVGHTGVELYETGKYLTITGQHVEGTPRTIETRTRELVALHAQVFGVEQPSAAVAGPDQPVSLTDAELLVKACTARNGAGFAALWDGNLAAYHGDASAGDLALCNQLAFWTGRNAEQIDRLFRQSQLMRPKWDSRRGKSTYGTWTITKAINDCTTVYTPSIDIELEDDNDTADPAPVMSTPRLSADAAPASDNWPTLHDDALVGLLGDLVRTIAPQTEADPVALLGHALVFWGNLINRNPYATVGAVRHHLNENVLFVGSTSSGRKGTAEGELRPVMAAVDEVWAETRLRTGLSSGEGLIEQIRDPREVQEPIKVKGQIVGYQRVVVDEGVSDKRLCIVEPEFGKVLRVSRREGNTLSATMRQCWDSGDLRVMTRHSPIQATAAHVSLIGHVTPLELRQELKSTDMANGFINRFLLLLVRRSQFLPEGGMVDAQRCAELVQDFVTATDAARKTGLIGRDKEASAYWADLYPTITRDRAGLVGAVCSRAPAHILRLSLLYALADRSAVVQLEHLKAAVAVWTYAEASVQIIFHQRTGHRLSDYLLALLRTYPEGLTRAELSGKLSRHRPADELHEALQRLLEYGLAICVKEPVAATGGRPAHRWFAAELSTRKEP
jgi:NrS-1  polymerase HBD domain